MAASVTSLIEHFNFVSSTQAKKKKKILLFPEMRATRKIFNRAAVILFLIDFPEIIYFLLYFLLIFFILVFCVCLFDVF